MCCLYSTQEKAQNMTDMNKARAAFNAANAARTAAFDAADAAAKAEYDAANAAYNAFIAARDAALEEAA